MRIKPTLILSISLVIFILSSCEKDVFIPPVLPQDDQGTLEIQFKPTMNGQPLEFNETYLGNNNQGVMLETFKAYLSSIKLHSGDSILGESEVELLDFSLNDKSLTLKSKKGTIDAISYDVGLPPALNGTNDPNYNPNSYENSHPLSIYNNMYWSWASGYIFLKIEGRLDTSSQQNQTPNFTFFYHCGLDTLTRSYELSNLNIDINSGQTTVVELALEMNDVLENVDISEEFFTHTSDNMELATKVIVNFGNAIRKL